MKTVKLTKKMTRDLYHLLTVCGAKHDGRGFPCQVYCNPVDCKAMQKEIYAQFKKEYPYLRKQKLQSSAGMHWLDLGPVECAGVRPGYVLVNDLAIAEEIEELKKQEANNETAV